MLRLEEVFITIKEMVQYFKLNKKDLKIAVQGFGNAGSNLAQMLWKDNFKVVAVSDSQGAVFYENGLDVEQIVKTKANSGSVINFPNGDKISNEEMLELPVNVLILAALENQVTETNASNIQATHIVEIANGPTTYQADEILFARNVIVVPDVLANSGGVIASYFEWSQNRTGNILDQKYLEERLRQKIITSWKKVINIRRKHKNKIDLRTAAYLIAIERILAAGKLRGYLK